MQENSKRQLIEQIRQHNTTAEEQYLMQFDETSLQQYLDRLIGAPGTNNRGVNARRLRVNPLRKAS